MNGRAGIGATIALLDFVLALAEALGEVLEDRRLSFMESVGLMKLAPSALMAVRYAPDLPGELKDLSELEVAELYARFAERLNLPDKKVEETVERLFRSGLVLIREGFLIAEAMKK